MLAGNIVHFARVLRAAGLPLGTDRVALALGAAAAVGAAPRRDFHDALQACLVDRPEHRELFDQAFEVFWRDPDLQGRMLQALLPRVEGRAAGAGQPRRLAEALAPARAMRAPDPAPAAARFDAAGTSSDRERLRKADFESMSADEWRRAHTLVEAIAPFLARRPTRRRRARRGAGQVEMAAALRAAARLGGELLDLPASERRRREEPLVALIDISGSVSAYSRVFLHFLAGLAGGGARVEAFVFGTRLTRITRWLRRRDPEVALAQVVAAVDDWSGGTRIAASLEEFNRRWARRVLGGAPTVLLMSDGLETGDAARLAHEAQRLALSCRRLVWLNPLLRYAQFAPRAAGVRALLPHVDLALPVHNVASLEQLARVLAQAGSGRGVRAAASPFSGGRQWN